MSEQIPVSSVGQIKTGDLILVCTPSENLKYRVQDVLPPAHDRGEEIILDAKKNTFFSTNLFLKGESWVKKVFIIEQAPITLTLTREQAEALIKGLNTGYLESSRQMFELTKQIEEKLK